MLTAVLSGFALALLAPWLGRRIGRSTGYVVALLPAGLTIYFGRFLSTVGQHGSSFRYEWADEIGLQWSFYVDGLSLLFALLIVAVGLLISIYTIGYLDSKRIGQFYAFLMSFMASMLGLVLAGNLLTLYVFWELTTLTSFLLIGFEHDRAGARAAAVQALLVTALGGLALLIGLVLLGQAAGTYDLSALLSEGSAIRQHQLYTPIVLLVLLGAFTKSAQFPFHFWLPSAMVAPTPVSAYLHSVTMVKAGIYLLARLSPVLGSTELWNGSLATFGAITMLVGAFLAYGQHDFKSILAYLTINVLGTLTLLLGIGTELSRKAAMVYLLAHALYKGALFLIAGAVDHATGTRDLRQLGGLWRHMPLTTCLAVLSALSMAGVIPLFGFIAKELFLEALWKAPLAAGLLTAAGLAASMLLAAGAALIGIRPFFGRSSPAAQGAHEASVLLWIGPVLLTAASLAMGLMPQQLATPVVEGAVTAIRQESTSLHLKLWHGLTLPFLFSVTALAGGALLYLVRPAALRRLPASLLAPSWGPVAWYRGVLKAVHAWAAFQTRHLQAGYLRVYVLTIVATMVGLVAFSLLQESSLPRGESTGIELHEAVIVLLIIASTGLAIYSLSRLITIVALTVTGLGVAWIFAVFSAPDLALTQLLIETLFTLLLVLVFSRLPKLVIRSKWSYNVRDAILAAVAGTFVTLLLLLATFERHPTEVSDYYVRNSVKKAHARNVVNAILVDYRAFDTLGEITVLTLAGLGAYGLLKHDREEKRP